MSNQIDLTQPVAEILEVHPELLELLINIGFKPLANPKMRNTVGRRVSIKQGAKMLNIPIEIIAQELLWNGYTIKGVKDD